MLFGPPLNPPPVATLADAFALLSERNSPWLHIGNTSYTGKELKIEADRYAVALARRGVDGGDRVLICLPNDQRFIAALWAITQRGAIAVPLPWPFALGDAGRALSALTPRVSVAAARALITTPEMAQLSPWAIETISAGEGGLPPSPNRPDPEDPAVVQFTSGSLGAPRGAVLSHSALVHSATAMGQAINLVSHDVAQSWLPLFHDMGLVGGLLVPLLHQIPLHLSTPAAFLLAPGRWLKEIAEVGATLSAAPDFAYALAARRARIPEGLDLSRWRCALDGSEPLHRSSIESFEARFPPVRLRGVYGLAEYTLGVCFADPLRPANDLQVGTRRVPTSGFPLPGTQVRVAAETGQEGEILVRGPSLMSGYFRDEPATAAAIQSGWLHTGDLGVVCQDQLHVTGRIKELVIQHGHKFHPYDIERVAGEAACAPPNGAAAFSHGPTERLIVLVESRLGPDLERTVRGRLLEELGVRADEVVALPPGSLPRTSSGKLRRAECRERYGAIS